MITKDHDVVVVTNKTELILLKNAEQLGVKYFVHETDLLTTLEDVLKKPDGNTVFYRTTLLPTLLENKKMMRIKNFAKTEMDLLKYFVKGYSNKIIAGLKNVSEETIKTHRRNMNKIVQDLRFDNLTEYAFETGLIKWNADDSASEPSRQMLVQDGNSENEIGRSVRKHSVSKSEGVIARNKKLAVDLYEDGVDVDAIANQLMVSETVVKKYLVEAGLLTGKSGL